MISRNFSRGEQALLGVSGAHYDKDLVSRVGTCCRTRTAQVLTEKFRTDAASGPRWRSLPPGPSACRRSTPPCQRIWAATWKTSRRDPVLAAEISRCRTSLVLFQHADDLLVREPRSLHRPFPVDGPLLQSEGASGDRINHRSQSSLQASARERVGTVMGKGSRILQVAKREVRP